MVARLQALAAEVTRVTLQLGSQGKVGGQAHVPDMEGVRLNLVRNVCVSVLHDALDENLYFDRVNGMSSSLTDQVRSIEVVTTAIAKGDLTQKVEISVDGEMSTLNGIFFLLDWIMDYSSYHAL
ncbi:hypothetical protein BYT27DRAFT_6486420 [Phlegmacium glaucopus]|nr:hypothetical protein BYT27DRAFT_6486420 [Phlegmacium glaucopus]